MRQEAFGKLFEEGRIRKIEFYGRLMEWHTKWSDEVRSLYQVKIEHADEAGKIFETLMGDVVEPRREFIQDNALKVVNLDV